MGNLSRKVGALCGVDFDAAGSRVVDHFSPVKAEQLGELGGSGYDLSSIYWKFRDQFLF